MTVRGLMLAGWGRAALSLLRTQTRFPSAAALSSRRCFSGADHQEPPCLDQVSAALDLPPDSDRRRRLHLAMLEYSELQISGVRVPDHLRPADWSELMRLPSISARRKYLAFLFKREKSRLGDEEKRRRRAEERRQQLDQQQQEQQQQPAHLQYGLGKNTIFHRITDTTIKSWEEQRLYTAMQFGQPLVVDLGFEPHMTRRENKNTAQQLTMFFSQNRAHPDPFDLHLCNLQPQGEILEFLQRMVPSLQEPSFPLHLHQQHYLELYPRDRLVYLTPHCRHELDQFDHSAIYIIGGLVDLVSGRPVSLAKAKKEGLRMAKLPITRYLSVGPSFDPSLTLVAMINILLELKTSGCWQRALQHVPRRGLLSAEDKQRQQEKQLLQLQQKRAKADSRQQRWQQQSRQLFNRLADKTS